MQVYAADIHREPQGVVCLAMRLVIEPSAAKDVEFKLGERPVLQ